MTLMLRIFRKSGLMSVIKLLGFLRADLYFSSIAAVLVFLLLAGVEAVGIFGMIPIIESLSDAEAISTYTVQINKLFAYMDFDSSLRNYFIFFFFLILSKAGLSFLSKLLTVKVQVSFEASFSTELLKSLFYSNGMYVENYTHGELINYVSNEVKKTGDCLYYLFSFCSIILRLIFYTIVLIRLSFELSLFVAALSVLFFIPSFFLTRKVHEESKKRIVLTNSLNEFVLQILSNLVQIKAFVSEDFFLKKYEKGISNYCKTHGNVRLLTDATSVIFEPIGVIVIGVVVFLAMNFYGIPFAEILVILYTLRTLVPLINQMVSYSQVVVTSLPSFNAVLEVTEGAIKFEENRKGLNIQSIEKGVFFEGVSYRYPLSNQDVLKEISFSVEKGSFVGIVGPSGSGKSTLVKLMMGFFFPKIGKIKIDDNEIEKINIQSWRQKVGLVSQNPILLSGTIKENISLGKTEDKADLMNNAVKRSYLYDFINDLPDGLETCIGSKGGNLSGGQGQRVAIARALYSKPEIILLDEPTSSLDKGSEQVIADTMLNLKSDKTVILVTHNLDLVKKCDSIIVLEKGRVVETGTFEELTSRETLFLKLYESENRAQIYKKEEEAKKL